MCTLNWSFFFDCEPVVFDNDCPIITSICPGMRVRRIVHVIGESFLDIERLQDALDRAGVPAAALCCAFGLSGSYHRLGKKGVT